MGTLIVFMPIMLPIIGGGVNERMADDGIEIESLFEATGEPLRIT